MIIFKHKRDNKYLITNYKVMFSSLSNQDNLERVSNKMFVLHKTLEFIGLRKKTSTHFLIRNPESRLQSFFENKFRHHIDKNLFSEWEHCQRIFFNHLKIRQSDSPEAIKAKILNFTYQDFIGILDDYFEKDAHLIPQIQMKNLSLSGFKLPLQNRPDKIYRMESASDLMQLGQTFNLDLSKKLNVSNKAPGQYALPDKLKQKLKTIYAADYELYSNVK